MLSNLPDDILFEISSYLNIIDTLKVMTFLKMDNCFILYYTPYIIKIQKWYFKYKKRRDIRYLTLKQEFQIRNEKMYTSFYANIFFSLYNLNKLKKRLKEYHFYCLLEYYCSDDKDILHMHENIIENMTYSNCKKFLKKLPMKLLLRT